MSKLKHVLRTKIIKKNTKKKSKFRLNNCKIFYINASNKLYAFHLD